MRLSNTRLRRAFAVSAVVAIAATVAACGSDDASEGTTAPAAETSAAAPAGDSTTVPSDDGNDEKVAIGPKSIGILPYIMAVEGNSRPAEAVKAAAEDAGFTADIVDAQGDPKNFTIGMNQFLAEERDAAALMWIPAEAISSSLTQAEEQGMLVGDLLSGPSDLTPWNDISYDVEEMADLNVEAIVALVGEEGEIFGVVDNNVANPRLLWEGIKSRLASEYPGIEVVGEHQSDVQNLVADAQTAVTTAIQQHPDLEAFWAVSDAQGTPMLSAINNSGKAIGLVSSNGQKEILDAIRDGQPVASVAVGFEQGGYQLVDTFIHLWAGMPIPDDNKSLSLQLITADNVPPAGESFEGEDGYREKYLDRWSTGFVTG